MSLDLRVVRFLFRQALRPVFDGMGISESVVCWQNQIFRPEGSNPYVRENVFLIADEMFPGGLFQAHGRACYDVFIPSGTGVDMGEPLAQKIVQAMPVGNYLRDAGPSGTGCAVLIVSSEAKYQRKNPSFPDWYELPVETSWQVSHFRSG